MKIPKHVIGSRLTDGHPDPYGIWAAPENRTEKIAPERDDDARTAPICECVGCDACGGRGAIWVDSRGRYLGQHPGDDLDEMEGCPNCNGRGMTEICQYCSEVSDED